MEAKLEHTLARVIPLSSPDMNDEAQDDACVQTLRALLAEVELAIAMVELARISRDPETVRRNYINARYSHERAMRLLPNATPHLPPATESSITTKLAAVTEALEAASRFLKIA